MADSFYEALAALRDYKLSKVAYTCDVLASSGKYDWGRWGNDTVTFKDQRIIRILGVPADKLEDVHVVSAIWRLWKRGNRYADVDLISSSWLNPARCDYRDGGLYLTCNKYMGTDPWELHAGVNFSFKCPRKYKPRIIGEGNQDLNEFLRQV